MSALNPFPAYLHEQLEDKLKERRIVVWYDPSCEFAPFIEGLAVEGEEDGLKRVCLGEVKTHLIVFGGSYFALRMRLEPRVAGNLARAIRRLAGFGFERFVLTADHGHQFSARKEDDMKLEAPAGGTLELHRRCWIGKGASAPSGTVTVKAPELGYDSNLEFVFPRGLGVFLSGGGLAYHHGGFSLQELVIPVISFRLKESGAEATGAAIRISEHPESITNRTFGVKLAVEADLLSSEPLNVRVLLISGGEEAGRAGMVLGAEFSRETGVLTLLTGSSASVAMVVTRDDVSTLRVVVQDALSGSVLTESKAIPVRLKS